MIGRVDAPDASATVEVYGATLEHEVDPLYLLDGLLPALAGSGTRVVARRSLRDMLRLVACEGWRPAGARWSPHYDYRAYRAQRTGAGTRAEVGWCETRTVGELGRTPGDGFDWTTKGNTLVIADPTGGTVYKLNVRTGARQDQAALRDDGDPALPPRVEVSPDGQRVAFTCRRAGEKVSEAWLIEHKGDTPQARLLNKQFPGARVALLPFWPPGGDALGLLAVDPGGPSTRIVTVPLDGGGRERVLYQSGSVEPRVAPAWSRSGRWLAFLRSAGAATRLSLLDCDDGTLVTLLAPCPAATVLGFGEESISLQGGPAAVFAWPKNLSRRRKPVERF